MKRFAFLSRHQPTAVQHELAAMADVELVCIGDTDAFTVKPERANSRAQVLVIAITPALAAA